MHPWQKAALITNSFHYNFLSPSRKSPSHLIDSISNNLQKPSCFCQYGWAKPAWDLRFICIGWFWNSQLAQQYRASRGFWPSVRSAGQKRYARFCQKYLHVVFVILSTYSTVWIGDADFGNHLHYLWKEKA